MRVIEKQLTKRGMMLKFILYQMEGVTYIILALILTFNQKLHIGDRTSVLPVLVFFFLFLFLVQRNKSKCNDLVERHKRTSAGSNVYVEAAASKLINHRSAQNIEALNPVES